MPEPIRLRTTLTTRYGRKVPRTLYLQRGLSPADDDPVIGLVDTPELAALIVSAVNDTEYPEPEPSEEMPLYRKVEQEHGATSRWMIICDEGWRERIICEGMYGHTADWLLGVLGRRPCPF